MDVSKATQNQVDEIVIFSPSLTLTPKPGPLPVNYTSILSSCPWQKPGRDLGLFPFPYSSAIPKYALLCVVPAASPVSFAFKFFLFHPFFTMAAELTQDKYHFSSDIL